MRGTGAPPLERPTPVDLGTGLVCASFGADGSWLSVGTPHPRHGFVELNALPLFDEAQRGHPTSTRAYRELMLSDAHAFLRLALAGRAEDRGVAPVSDDALRPAWVGRIGPVRVRAEAEADGETAIRQRWWLDLQDPDGGRPSVRLQARGRLDRPALAEISELEPPAPTLAQTRLTAHGARLLFRAPGLPATAGLVVSGVDAGWVVHDAGHATLDIPWASGSLAMRFDVVVGLGGDEGLEPVPARVQAPALSRSTTGSPPGAGVDRITRRAVAYVRGCTALRTAADELAILTDHRLLPLSWTRDAYYQALLLLVTDGPGDRDRVADHLRWLWRRNERPDGRWVRSHHANGRRKDVAFQADQQLYPLLELADFRRVTGSLPGGVDWATAIPAAWKAALGELNPELGLVATGENAADDPAAAPYIAGSQIVLWYAARRLADLAAHERIDLDPESLLETAVSVRAVFDGRLAAGGSWAYAIDDGGRPVRYHDANDLPVALAPAWGFCGPDDAAWLATMRFAFSPANPGFWDGRMPGLGSAHTPGAWTLGDIQAWLFATLSSDASAASAALDRLDLVATADGMLPEAYRLAADGRLLRTRHWFAWPGAALGALRMLARRGSLAELLAAA